MTVIKATADLLDEIMQIYASAQRFMVESGNPTQWAVGHPSRETAERDIALGQSYAVMDGGKVVGVFAFILGQDPTYKDIDGAWLSDAPYGTIHRIAKGSDKGGVFDTALSFCLTKTNHIRVDTHANNRPMQKVILSHGFSYRGVIRIADGSPRNAYELII